MSSADTRIKIDNTLDERLILLEDRVRDLYSNEEHGEADLGSIVRCCQRFAKTCSERMKIASITHDDSDSNGLSLYNKKIEFIQFVVFVTV